MPNLTKLNNKVRRTFMSNNHITNELNNQKSFFFVTNNELSELKENIVNQILRETKTPIPKKDPLLMISGKLATLGLIKIKIF